MRHTPPRDPAPSPSARSTEGWATIRALLPYLWEYKARVILAFTFLVGAKVANVGVPLIMKQIVDGLGVVLKQGPQQLAFGVIAGLLLAYGAARLSTTVFTELREFVFAKVTQSAVRKIALQVFRHLHSLSLRFHLDRATGGMTRDIERGTRGVSSLVSYTPLQHPAHAGGNHPGAGDPGHQVQPLVRRHHGRPRS